MAALGQWWSEKSPVVQFALAFASVMALFYAFYFSPLYDRVFLPPIINTQAGVAGGILNLFGMGVEVSESIITGSGTTVNVKNGCDGLEAIALLSAAILIFPLPFKYKWQGLLAGIAVLLVLNQLRIAGLYLVQRYWPQAFDFLHLHGGFVLFTFASILLSMIWIRWALRKHKLELQHAES